MAWLIIILVVLLGFIIAGWLVLRRAGGGSFPWIQFYLKGKESGFAFQEVNLLRKIAVENRMKDPTSLFWSIKQLDRSIRGIILNFRAQNSEDNPKSVMILSKLFEFRKRVEFARPKYSLGLRSSREIPVRQKIRVSLPNMLPFTSLVVDNLRRYMAISYPRGPKLPFGFNWKNQMISINFWREGDAGYYYQTKVLGDYSEKKYPILHVLHKDNLIRSQMRRSHRAEIGLPAVLYPLRNIDEANEELEDTRGGLRSIILDVSEDGAALMVGGRAKVGLPLKFQFGLANQDIVMNGIVKGVNFDEKKNRSILHVQARIPSRKMKNNILMFVYNIFSEQTTQVLQSKQAVQK